MAESVAHRPRRSWRRDLAVGALLALLAGCGGDGSPASAGGSSTASFSGTTSSNAPGSCSGDSHRINAGQGTLAVTLVQSSGGALMVQLCSPGAVDHTRDCTINRTRIEVGRTLSGTLRGGSLQELAFNPLSCGGGEPPPPAPISYTASLVYPL